MIEITSLKESPYKWKIVLGAIGCLALIAVLLLFGFSGENFDLLKSFFTEDFSQEELRDKFRDFDWQGYVAVILLTALQISCPLMPAEPIQLLAGLAFGFFVGVLCCWIGVWIGCTVIFWLQRSSGDKVSGFLAKKLHLDLDKIAKSSKCVLVIFLLYFLPILPYCAICFFTASIGMRYRRYVTITMLASLPSVCIGVGLGYVAIASHWILAACMLVVILLMGGIAVGKREILFSKLNDFADQHKSTARNMAQKPNGFVMSAAYIAIRFYCFLCGVRVKAVNKVGQLEKPSIILCNHGSFVDFIFAGALLRKCRPNFVVARLYFYDSRLRWLLKTVGAFPKSMFALDVESTKNCVKVLKNGGCLAMMPEARLSTTGRFEDIQENTYSFLKKSAVPIYTVKFDGDYFANPKWGKGFRRGAVVEAELDILFTAEDIERLTREEIQKAVEARLYYNEFQWLKARPYMQYRSNRMAEGLENILTRCPVCGQKHTITTKKDQVFCQTCGYLTSLDNRYSFTGEFRFADLSQWYDWQKECLRKEILENKAYSLSSEVELRLPSKGRGLTRSAGQGVCTLSRDGLTYCGTKDGEMVDLHFSLAGIYRLLFGAGENFETYNGTEILYFVPTERRSAVDWYMASMILHDEAAAPDPK